MLRNEGDPQLERPVLESFTYVDPWTGDEKEQTRYIESMPAPALVLTPKMAAELLVRRAGGRLVALGKDRASTVRFKGKRGN
ncbi:hypothetical protein BSE24067_06674 [Burkholderia seminalis]|nr:hypothetical protein BSE24067_06674 [Burkholderia seminalis]